MSSDEQKCIPIYSFELILTVLPTEKFQLTKEHDQAQNNILEMHSCSSHSSYTKEFDVKTYILELVKYMLCLFILLSFQIVIRDFNTNIFSKLTRIKLKSNKIMTQHNNPTYAYHMVESNS